MLQKRDSGILFRREGETLLLEPYGPGIIRVRAACTLPGEQRWTLLPPAPCAATAELTDAGAELHSGGLSAKITPEGQLSFHGANGVLLEELWSHERDQPARVSRCHAGGLFHLEVSFRPRREHLYGMGQEAHDLFDLKGSVIDLCQQNTKCTIPFVVSSRGYGFLWNNPGIGRAEFGAGRTRWVAEGARQLDYLVIAGQSTAEIVRRYASITGFAPHFPEWATGLWQSKLRYETQEELLAVAREYRRRGIPLSMIVCDYFHWPQQGEWKFDPRYWPDPAAMVAELAEMGIRLLVSIWPTVDPRSENFLHMRENNYLVRTERGPGVLFFCRGPESHYDATNPEAGAFVLGRIRENYIPHGIHNFWLDESEPELTPYDYDNLRFHLGNGLEVANIYPYYYAKNFHDGLRESGREEILNLIRCAWVGSQRFGVVLWSGDIESNFDSLRRQIKAGLHVSLCGIPWWTTDIGGFHGGDPDDPAYRECFVRWFQFGAFCPVFRMHGFRHRPGRPTTPPFNMDGYCPSGGPNELWSYGEEAYGILLAHVRLREALRPYIQRQLDLASADGTPVMRPLLHDYDDEPCYDIFDQYLFGPALMVCPVHEAGRRERTVYLPAGKTWIDAYTGAEHPGGGWITTPAPLERIPLFLVKNAELTTDPFRVL